MTGNAKIGVSTKATDTVAITTEGKDQAAFFEADDSAHFEISTSQVDNSIYLAKKGGAAFTNSTVPENNVYSAALSGTMDQLMDQLLTPEEKAEIAAGTLNIEVMLTASDTVSEDEKRQIEAAKGNAQIGKYINLTLMIKKSGKDEWLPVQNTAGGPVTITLQVPGELINSNGAVTRTYQIIRLHSGADGMVATVLPCTYDPATGTVSFQTDRFSAYAIAYTDQQNGDSGSGGSGDGGSAAPAAEAPKLDAVPKTGDSNEAAVLLAFALLSGIGAVILWKGSYRKENSH